MDIDFSDSCVIVATTNQVSCELGDSTVILDLKAGLYFSLDNVGAKVWEFIQQPRCTSEIRQVILDTFDVSRDVCQQDLSALLRDLADRHLIEIKDAAVV